MPLPPLREMLDRVEPWPRPETKPLALSALSRFLLWDYSRGSLPYDVVVVLLLLLVFLVPPGFWADPMVSWP